MYDIYESIQNIIFSDPNINSFIAANNDNSKDKIDLSVGALCDKNGIFYMFKSVGRAERLVVANENRTEKYLLMSGDDEYCVAARSLLFPGVKHEELDKLISFQTFGSTGAIYLTLQLFAGLGYNPNVYLSNPTWCNYYSILERVGLSYIHYPYVKEGENILDIDGMIECLSKAKYYDILILQVCSHNPTGIDLNESEWSRVLSVVQQRKLVVLFDIPYQGLSKDIESDVYPCSLFLNANPPVELYIAQSFSKIMGLCSARIGCLHIRTNTNIGQLKVALNKLIRSNYGSPPRHYAASVKLLLTTPELREEWLEELKSLANGMKKIRKDLCNMMVQEIGDKWNFIGKQTGMFAFLNIEEQMVGKLREKHIHMSLGGRIIMSKVNENNMVQLVKTLKEIINTNV